MPSISIIIPAYNEEENIKQCLDSIIFQDYPKSKLEILVVDDASIDNTVKIAKSYGARILRNGTHNIEIGKSIGLQHAKSDLVLFLDADNILPSASWIKEMAQPFLECQDIVGAEPIYFHYNKDDPLANRYCSLFGINDPTAFYLKVRDRLMWTEKRWNLLGTTEDRGKYYIATFNKQEIPTLGSIGFLIKRELLLKTSYKPFLFHIDSNCELIEMGYNRYALLKMSIIHLHSDSVRDFLRKMKRNVELYFKFRSRRRFNYLKSKPRVALAGFKMVTFIKPMYDSIKGYMKIRDVAWFLNPLLCFLTVFIHGFALIKWWIKKSLGHQSSK